MFLESNKNNFTFIRTVDTGKAVLRGNFIS